MSYTGSVTCDRGVRSSNGSGGRSDIGFLFRCQQKRPAAERVCCLVESEAVAAYGGKADRIALGGLEGKEREGLVPFEWTPQRQASLRLRIARIGLSSEGVGG